MPDPVIDVLPPGAREFVPERENPASWARWHRFRLARHEESTPDDRPDPDAVEEAHLRREDPFQLVRRFVLERDGEVVSRVHLRATRPGSPEYPSNRHNVFFDIEVLAAHRRQGIGSSWLPAVAAFAAEREARLLTADTSEPSGYAFLDHVGAAIRFRGHENRLWLDRVDWDQMRAWAAIDPAPIRLERYEPFPPESIWEAYARDYTEMERHVPREGLEVGDWILTPERMRVHRERLQDQGKTLHVLTAWDEQGMVAVTEMIRADHDPEALQQELTAVHPRARGRGLGKLLKARLLLEMHERYPEVRYVRTWNAGSNAPMLSINERMGFRPHRDEIGYQLTLSDLVAGLNRALA